MMEGKWFADSFEGVLKHAASLYPDTKHHIVAADIPDDLLVRLHRSPNLDLFGPATYLEEDDLVGIVPILELDTHVD